MSNSKMTSKIGAAGVALALAIAPATAFTAFADNPNTDSGTQQSSSQTQTSSKSLADATVKMDKEKYQYDGKLAVKPKPTVTLGGKTLEEFKDYNLTYSDNEKAGTGKVRVSAVVGSDYTEWKDVEFTIEAVEYKAPTFEKAAIEKFDIGNLDGEDASTLVTENLENMGKLPKDVKRVVQNMPAGKYRITLDEGYHALIGFVFYDDAGNQLDVSKEKTFYMGDTSAERNMKDSDGPYVIEEIELPANWRSTFNIDRTGHALESTTDKALHFELIEKAQADEPKKDDQQQQQQQDQQQQQQQQQSVTPTANTTNTAATNTASNVKQQSISKTADYVVPTVLGTVIVAGGTLLVLRRRYMK